MFFSGHLLLKLYSHWKNLWQKIILYLTASLYLTSYFQMNLLTEDTYVCTLAWFKRGVTKQQARRPKWPILSRVLLFFILLIIKSYLNKVFSKYNAFLYSKLIDFCKRSCNCLCVHHWLGLGIESWLIAKVTLGEVRHASIVHNVLLKPSQPWNEACRFLHLRQIILQTGVLRSSINLT